MSLQAVMRKISLCMYSINKNHGEYFEVCIDDKDRFKWYFLIKGQENTDYEGGYYLGELLFTNQYPAILPKPVMLTPTGKFMINRNLCISTSKYELSQNRIFELLCDICGDMQDKNNIYYDPTLLRTSITERKYLAIKSVVYNKTHYPEIINKFQRFLDHNGNSPEHIKNIHMFWLIKFSLDNNLDTDMINYIFKLFYYMI